MRFDSESRFVIHATQTSPIKFIRGVRNTDSKMSSGRCSPSWIYRQYSILKPYLLLILVVIAPQFPQIFVILTTLLTFWCTTYYLFSPVSGSLCYWLLLMVYKSVLTLNVSGFPSLLSTQLSYSILSTVLFPVLVNLIICWIIMIQMLVILCIIIIINIYKKNIQY